MNAEVAECLHKNKTQVGKYIDHRSQSTIAFLQCDQCKKIWRGRQFWITKDLRGPDAVDDVCEMAIRADGVLVEIPETLKKMS